MKTQSGLDGALLDPTTLLLIACGTAGGLLFTAVYLIEGATRPGYDAWSEAISALSLGPGGWLQQLNFMVFGVLMICSALGWRRALTPGIGALAYPVLRGIAGAGLILIGVFSQDPAAGYPPGSGAAVTGRTVHAQLHNVFSVLTITALAIDYFVLAWRFANEPRWRFWAPPAVITGLLTMAFIAAFGAMVGHRPAGMFERLSSGVGSLLILLVLGRLLAQSRAAAEDAPGSGP